MKKIILLTLFLLTSCTAATGPIFAKHAAISNDESIIYVYRPLSFDGATVCFDVTINDLAQGCLGTSGFISASVKPGKNKIKLKGAAVTLEFIKDLESGKAYYFEYQLNKSTAGALASQWVYALGGVNNIVIETPEDIALAKLSTLKLSK